ncbi:MAG: type 4a pilus biogenesis protein PilO [Pseudomonadota bacterium]|nr:type 4a pilus biogenesis protein PilO [Pseudomonadota bacterium]
MAEFFEKLTFGLVIFFGISLAALYYIFLYNDGSVLDSLIVNKNIEYGLKEKVSEGLKRDIEEGLLLKEKVAVIGSQFKEAFEFLPAEFQADKLISDISKQAQVAGATVVKMSPQKETKKESIYESMGIDFELKGSFSSLTLFIANISKIKRILEVEELKFINTEEDIESPIINLNGRIVGYRYLSQEEPGNANEKK